MNKSIITADVSSIINRYGGIGKEQGKKAQVEISKKINEAEAELKALQRESQEPVPFNVHLLMKDVEYMSTSFATWSLFKPIERNIGKLGFCLVGADKTEVLPNFTHPVMHHNKFSIAYYDDKKLKYIHPSLRNTLPNKLNQVFQYVLKKGAVSSNQLSKALPEFTPNNACLKLKLLLDGGLVLRHDRVAGVGAYEHLYYPIR